VLYPDLIDVPIEVFGGYCCAVPLADLPSGAATIAQDVQFPMAGLRTRGNLLNFFTGSPLIPAGASINGLKSYITPVLTKDLLIWDSLGNLFKENPQGTLNLINSRPYAGLFYNSQTLFGREYQAFFNSLGGFDIPRQYDDTNFDRVSQVGPGAAPTVVNFVPPGATLTAAGGAPINIVASPTGIVWGGSSTTGVPPHQTFYFTYFIATTTVPHGLAAGQRVTIAGSGTTVPAVNGTYNISAVPSPTTFRIAYSANQAIAFNGGGGTVSTSSGAASLVRSGNQVNAVTVAAHGFQPGWSVIITGYANIAIGGAITAISQSGGVATATTTTAHVLVVGAAAIITGTTNYNSPAGGWIVTSTPSPTTFTFAYTISTSAAEAVGAVATPLNGTFTILTTPSATTFTYAQLGPDESSNTVGTASITGNISPGLHNVSLAFITRQGFITQASPPTPFYANGSQLAGLSDIATGPPNVVARMLIFTPAIIAPATAGSFYSITSTMVINDNTTTAAVVDFLDVVLQVSFTANYLFTQIELGECANFLGYNSRTVFMGERAKVPNFDNLTFDGGFGLDASNRNWPLGWTEDPNNYVGGYSALAQGLSADWGDAFAIGSTGIHAVTGAISQSAYQDYLGVPIIAANTSYSVRARVAKTAAMTNGAVHINLRSPSGGLPGGAFQTAGLTLAPGQLTSTYQEFIFTLTDVAIPTPPADLVLQVYADGSPSVGGFFLIDSIEPFAVLNPFNYSTARFSHAFNPESFDSITGQVQVRPGDGQQLRAGFPLRNNLYLAKDHYLGYVTDDGVNEPASWAFNEVSSTIGICGSNAVDTNEEWAVFAERSGLYVCWGSDPVKITPEIQIDASNSGKVSWASINWTAAYTIWVRIDRANKMILVGAPTGVSVTPNQVFMLDYRWLDNAEDIASNPMVTYSSYTGKILGHGKGRRWATWNITANSMCFAERADGTVQPFFGNGVGNGKVYQQLDPSAQASDDGVAVNCQYQTYGCPSPTEEALFQLGAHRKLLGYLKWLASGVGSMNLTISTTQRPTTLRTYPLSLNPVCDGGRGVNIHGERFYWNVGTSAVGSYFQLERLVMCMKKEPGIVVRGTNQ
jgi:hypothetical protein